MKTNKMFALCFIGLLSSLSFLHADPQDDFRRAVEMLAESPLIPETKDAALKILVGLAQDYESRAETDYRLWYEAGNAWWWAKEPGKAILDYRRYLAHDPFRSEVWENLAEARKSAGTVRVGGEGFGAWPWILWLLHIGALCFGLSALGFGVFAWTRAAPWKKVGILFAGITAVSILGVAADSVIHPRMGVCLVEVQGRKGDATVYAAQPEKPWKMGQEGWIMETRDGWVRLSVGGATSWVPRDTIEEIAPVK